MAQYNIKGPIDDDFLNKVNHMFTELYKEYIGSGLDASEAKKMAIQAVADSALAKENASVAKEMVQQIIDESIDLGVLNTNIEQKLNDLEVQYAPKLTQVTQQLAETATKNEVSKKADQIYVDSSKRDKSVPITLNDADEFMLAAIAGGEGTEFNLESIPRDYSVTPTKTTFFEGTKNLYHGDLVDGFVYGTGSGGRADGEYGSDGTAKSCIIKIEPGETYAVTPYGGDRSRYAVYENYPEIGDAPVEFILSGASGGMIKTFTSPDKGHYLAIFLSTEGKDVKCQVEKGEESTEYELPHKINNDMLGEFSGSKIKIGSIAKRSTDFILSTKNLYHGDLVPGFIYDQDDPRSGQFADDVNARVCIIKIEPNETCTVTPYGGNRKLYAVYEEYPEFGDEAVVLVNGTNHNANPVTFTNPGNGHYLVVYLSREGEDVKCQVERGSNSTKYEFPYKLDERIRANGDAGNKNAAQLEKIKDRYYVYSTFQLDYKPASQEPANEDGSFNGNTSKHSDIYGLYDRLMAKFPDCFTKYKSGEDGYGLPIYTYKYDPPYPRHHESFPVERLKLLFFSGVHGDERTWPYTLFKIMEEICERSEAHEVLSYLRWNTTIIVTPVVVPSGYDDDTRNNRKGININRNFEYQWEPNSGGGSEPFSEPEAKAVKKVIDEHLDGEILLDFHNYFSPQNHLLWAPLGRNYSQEGYPKFINSFFSMTTGKWTQEYEWMPEDEELSRISEELIATLASYGAQKGMVAHTVEIRDHIPQKPNNKKLDETNIEFSMEYAVNMIAGIINTL